MTDAVVLLSGGIDSTTLLAAASRENENVLALSCQYGQKHSIELDCARAIAWVYSAHWRLVHLPQVFGGAGSTLIDPDLSQPHLTYTEINESKGPSPTVVPFRNANLISVATSIAVVEKASFVYVAAHGEDAHNWAYPDCTPEFLGAMSNAIYIGTYHEVQLKYPFVWMMKRDIVALGAKLKAPYHLTYSCYAGGKLSCGLCPTCVERIEAFKYNKLIDPIDYEIDIDWEGCNEYHY